MVFALCAVQSNINSRKLRRGAYDDLYDATDNKISEQAQHDRLIEQQQSQQQLVAEQRVYNDIVEKISKTQLEILDVALQNWKENEIAKISETPEEYISTDDNE